MIAREKVEEIMGKLEDSGTLSNFIEKIWAAREGIVNSLIGKLVKQQCKNDVPAGFE